MISLRRAVLSTTDTTKLYTMQKEAFRELLEKYGDYETNPAAEGISKTIVRLCGEDSHYYFIMLGDEEIGGLRVVVADNTCKVSPLYVLPMYQGMGYAQQAMELVETFFPQVSRWWVETIAEEEKLCRFYEKLGYRRTGGKMRVQPGMTLIDYEKECNRRMENGNL